MSRGTKVVKRKQKAVASAPPAVRKGAAPARTRSDRRVEKATRRVGIDNTDEFHDSAGLRAREGTPLASVLSKMSDQLNTSDLPQRQETMIGVMEIYSQATATALAALQAWFELPVRNLQTWYDACFRLHQR